MDATVWVIDDSFEHFSRIGSTKSIGQWACEGMLWRFLPYRCLVEVLEPISAYGYDVGELNIQKGERFHNERKPQIVYICN